MEKVHTFALKKLLNVSPRTPNDISYGETGRFPLYVHSYTACIKYWLRLTTMDISSYHERLTISCYCCIIAASSVGCHRCIRSCTNLASDLFGKVKVCKIQKHSSRHLNKGLLIAIARTGMSTSAIVPDLPYIGCLRSPFP